VSGVQLVRTVTRTLQVCVLYHVRHCFSQHLRPLDHDIRHLLLFAEWLASLLSSQARCGPRPHLSRPVCEIHVALNTQRATLPPDLGLTRHASVQAKGTPFKRARSCV
jgi:hypothetical protein